MTLLKQDVIKKATWPCLSFWYFWKILQGFTQWGDSPILRNFRKSHLTKSPHKCPPHHYLSPPFFVMLIMSNWLFNYK